MVSRVTDHYRILGVKSTATRAEIRAAFLVLAKQHHPDRAPESERESAERRMRQITEAYEVLSDSARRAHFDLSRHAPVARPAPAEGGFWSPVDSFTERLGFSLERIPWYGWLFVGPAAVGLGLFLLTQYVFYYMFVYGIVILVPLIAAWYLWLVSPLLGVMMIPPTLWLWGFLLQGLWRNKRDELRQRQARAAARQQARA